MAVLVILAHPAIVGSVASASDESDWFDAGDRADIAEFGDDPSSKELDYASATLVGPFEFNSKTYYVAQYDGAAPSRFELDIERAKYSKDLLNDVNIGLIPRVKFFKKENGDLISISDPNRELVNTILRTNKARFHAQTKTSVNTPLNREVVDFQKNAISGLSSKITFPKQELSKLTKEKKDRYFAALKLMTERGTESIIPDEYEERIKKNVKDTSTLAGYADQTASLASELSKRQATLNDAAARRNMKLAAKALRKSSDVYENLAKRIKISEYSKSGDQVTAALSIFDLVIRLSESTVYADAKVKRLSRIQEYAASTEGVSLDSGLSDGIDRIKALKEDASAPEIAKDIEFWIKESVAGELGTYAAEKALKKFVTWKFSQTAASTALVAVAAADVGLTAGGLLTGKNKVWKRFTHAKYSRLAMMEFREVRKHIEKSKRESHLTGERAEAYYSAVYFEYESRAKFYEQMESGLQGTKVDDVLDFIQDRRGEEIAGKLAEDARNNTGLVGYVPTNETIGKTPTRPSIRFIDQTISSGSSAITIDTAEFSTQAASDGEFVVVIHKTTEETYGDGIGPKIGESDVLPPGTRQSVEVDLSRTLGPSDDIAELTESQSLVAMLHRADTDDGDNINHGSHITRNGDKVTSRAQVTVSSPPDRTLYTAGFESTPSGETPSDWTASGNSAIRVSNAQAADGTKSLRLSGSSGMCLETVGFGNLGQDSLFTQKTAGSASFSDRFDDGTLNSQWEGAGIDDPQVTESDGTLNHAVDFNYGSDNNRLQTTQTFDTTGTHRIEMRIRTTQSDYWGYGVALDGTNGKINLKEGKWEGFNRFVVSGVTDRPDKYSSDYNFYGEQTHKAKLADATSETSFITYSLTVNFDTQTVTEVRRGSKTWDTDLQIKDIGDSYQLRLPTGAGHDVEYDAIAVGPADGEWSLFNDAANEQMPTPTSTSSSSQSMNISFSVRPGGQAQTGCHDHNTGVNLNTGNDGTYGGEKIKLIEFTPDGSVEATFGENTPLGSYDVGTWTDVRVKYTPLKEGQARVAYFIDGEQRETITRGEPSFADQLSYLQVNTGEYTTYVDDIDITSAPSAETESPEANAGEDQTITAGKTVELDASGSAAPDNSVLSYQFQQVSQAGSAPDVSLQAPETQKTEFTAPDVDSETTVTFELTVTNSAGKTDTDRVNITITPPGVDTWTIPMEYPQFQMTTGDVDDDGSAELAVGNHGSYGPSEFGVVEQGRWVWNQSSDAPVHAETIGTVDTDMSPEFIFKSKVSSTWVRPYGIDTSSLWSVTHRGWPDTVRAADTDNDGKSEIAAMSHNNGYLTVIDNDGDVTWRTQSRANIERLFGLTEVTGDDTPEILTHSPPNDDKQGLQLITKTDTGGVEVVWRAEPNAPVRATLSELDSDTDASEEVIAAYPGRGLITSLDAETGETRWREQVASADRIRFADVTGDETPEVLLWSDTTLRVFSADSRSLIELSTSAPILRATGSGNGTLLLLTEDALISRTAEEELTRVQIDGTQVNEMSVGDTDGDNNPEVALGAGGSLRLYDNLEMASSQLEFPPDERPPASVTFTDQTISSGSSTLTVDTAQFGNQTVSGEKFVVVVHKTTESTYDDEIGPKVGESDVLSPGTQQSIEVDLSRTLGPSDDIDTVSNSQSFVAMLHRADTDDGDNINHGPHITRNGDKVTSRAQITVDNPPSRIPAENALAINDSRVYTIANDSIRVYNLDTRELMTQYQAPDGTDQGLAYGNGSLWYSDADQPAFNGQVLELNPTTGEVRSRIDELGYDPYGLAYGDGSVWAGEVTGVPNELKEYSPGGSELGGSDIEDPAGSAGPNGVAYFNGSIWIGTGTALFELGTNGNLKGTVQERPESESGFEALAGSPTALYGSDSSGNLTVLRQHTPQKPAVTGLSVVSPTNGSIETVSVSSSSATVPVELLVRYDNPVTTDGQLLQRQSIQESLSIAVGGRSVQTRAIETSPGPNATTVRVSATVSAPPLTGGYKDLTAEANLAPVCPPGTPCPTVIYRYADTSADAIKYPDIEIGQNRTVTAGEQFTLNISGSLGALRSDALNYTLSQRAGPDVELRDSQTATPEVVVPDAATESALVFALTATDSTAASETEILGVTVRDQDREQATLKIQPQTVSVQPGETVTTDVVVNTTEAEALAGAEASLQYNSSLFDATVSGGSFLSSDGADTNTPVPPTVNETTGTIDYSEVRLASDGVNGEGTLFTVTLEATRSVSEATASPLRITQADLSTPDQQSIPSQLQNGTATIQPQPPSTVEVQPTDQELVIQPTGTASVDVVVNATQPLAASSASLEYNTSLLNATVSGGPFLSSDGADTNTPVPPTVNETTGTVSYSEFRLTPEGITGEGVLFTVVFEPTQTGATARGTTTPVTLTDVSLSTPDQQPVPTQLSNTTATIPANTPPTLNATLQTTTNNVGAPLTVDVNATDAETAVANLSLSRIQTQTQTQTSTISESQPQAELTTTPTESSWTGDSYAARNYTVTASDTGGLTTTETVATPVYIPGDTNGDGVVDIFDAVAIGSSWQAQRGQDSYSDAGDLNNDGVVDIFDAVAIGSNWQRQAQTQTQADTGTQTQTGVAAAAAVPESTSTGTTADTDADAGTGAVVSVTPQTTQLSTNATDPFTVDIVVNTTQPLAGVQADLEYNTSVLNASVSGGPFLSSDGADTNTPVPPTVNETTGTVSYSEFRLASEGITGNGTVFTVTFEPTEATPDSQLSLTGVSLSDPGQQPIATQLQNGTVTTNPTNNRTDASVIFKNQSVSNGSTSVTIASATFNGSSQFNVVVHEASDANGDGTIQVDEIGTKIGESVALENGTTTDITVDISKQVAESDDVGQLTENQTLVAMLHTTNTSDGDSNIHAAPITRNGTPVFNQADVTVEKVPITTVQFNNQTVLNGSTSVTIQSAQFGNESVRGKDFVVVVHETDDGDIGTKIGESAVIAGNQTNSNITVNLSKDLGPNDGVSQLSESQELVAMLHLADTGDGDNINHGANNLSADTPTPVTDRAQVARLGLQAVSVNRTAINQPGQPVKINAVVANEGATENSIQLALRDRNTEQLARSNVSVASETTRTVSFNVTPTQTETFSIQGPASTRSVTIDVAELALEDATLVTQQPVTTNDTVVVNATVTNTGTATGFVPLTLRQNGTVLNSTTQEVPADSTVTAQLQFTTSLDEGTQNLTVTSSLDNQSATVGEVVVAPPEAITNATVRVGSESVGPGGTATVNLTLDQAPQGLAGYNLTARLSVADSGVRVVEATAPTVFNDSVTETTIGSANQTAEIRATDITEVVDTNATNASLGTVTVAANESANVSQTDLRVSVERIDDDSGTPINVTTQNGTVTVREQGPLASGLNPPSDPDGDGVFEDVNGNGRVDFSDVVALFENLPDARAPFQDFNDNGRIDFDDIVELFKEI